MSAELYCGHCGGALDGGTPGDGPAAAGGGPTSDARPGASAHHSCRALLALEPPRYCAQCRRRMKVQVTPLGWRAECSRHGSLAG
ncbi:hypothetical protein [Arthrobacter sp. R-11]|uniref:biotin synthase auxiliary protein BsaP n=1 Tax=Arthrobacter sp. R-11 TaxID=3404053 RepID=UPI003CFA919F